ncbi:hypothetical protein Tco_0011120 [Tanacetum coccineum]
MEAATPSNDDAAVGSLVGVSAAAAVETVCKNERVELRVFLIIHPEVVYLEKNTTIICFFISSKSSSININNKMVLYLVPDDVPTVPAIPAPHWDDLIVSLSNEEYFSDDEKYDIPEDDVVLVVPAVLWDDVIVISSDEEPEMPAKKVSVKSRKRVFALVDESDSDDDCWSNAFIF